MTPSPDAEPAKLAQHPEAHVPFSTEARENSDSAAEDGTPVSEAAAPSYGNAAGDRDSGDLAMIMKAVAWGRRHGHALSGYRVASLRPGIPLLSIAPDDGTNNKHPPCPTGRRILPRSRSRSRRHMGAALARAGKQALSITPFGQGIPWIACRQSRFAYCRRVPETLATRPSARPRLTVTIDAHRRSRGGWRNPRGATTRS